MFVIRINTVISGTEVGLLSDLHVVVVEQIAFCLAFEFLDFLSSV